MIRGKLMADRTVGARRTIEDLHVALSGLTARPTRWNQEAYQEVDPRIQGNFEGTVYSDGSMTLNSTVEHYLDLAYRDMYELHLRDDPEAGPEVVEGVRNAVGVFVRNYVDLYHEQTPADEPTSALDSAIRANTTAWHLPKAIAGANLHRAYPRILELREEDQHPLLQAAAETLCQQVAKETGTVPSDLHDRLQATAPAERWDVLADAMIKQRLGPRLEPSYRFAGRVLPEDAARIKALLVKDLKNGFQACATKSAENGQDTRSNGRRLAGEAVQTAVEHLETFANSGPKPTESQTAGRDPAYAEVWAIVSRVQGDLAAGRDGDDDNLARFLRPGQRIKGWNGNLEATNEGGRNLGEAHPDGTLAFDGRRVLAPLAEAHTSARPLDAKLQADVRRAIVVVSGEAARLCSPGDPGNDPAARAMEDGLVEVYAKPQADRLMADFGYGEPRPGSPTRRRPPPPETHRLQPWRS